MRSVVSAEVGNDFRNLTLKLDVERLDNIEPPPIRLPGDNPIYVVQSPRANAILAKMFEKFGRRSGKIKFLPWSSI